MQPGEDVLDSHEHFRKLVSAGFKAAAARGIEFFGKNDAAPGASGSAAEATPKPRACDDLCAGMDGPDERGRVCIALREPGLDLNNL